MKINFKHVAATAMAVAMSLSLAVPAFAVGGNGGNKTLTVTGATLDNKNVYAVQMFTARLTESAGSNTFDSYELAEEWMPFFKDTTAAGINLQDQDRDGDVDSDDARAYVEKLKDKDLVNFADKAQAWVRSHDGQPSGEPTEFANKIITATADSDTAQFTDLKPGYYLVYPEGGGTGNNTEGAETSRGTDAMLVNVPRDKGEAILNIKSTFPTVEKTVEDNNENTNGDGANGSAQVGDTVTFTLTSKVPDMKDYTTFYFAFNDTLSHGLEFVKAGDTATTTDVTVTIDGQKVESNYYTVSLDGTALKVVFKDLKSVAGNPSKVGKDIVVTYQAKITADAVSTGGSIVGNAANEVYLEYSNNPGTEGTGTSTPDTSKVYTYQIGIHKYTGEWNKGSAAYLANAKFVLSTSAETPSTPYGSNVIKLVKNTDNEYRVATADDSTTTCEFTTNDKEIVIKGLKAGTYYLHEVAAPNGYNKLKEPIKITISVSGGDASFERPVYTIGSTANTGSDDTVAVLNNQGIELPETGSIGTIGLTVAGVAIVLIGVFAPRKKKKSNQE